MTDPENFNTWVEQQNKIKESQKEFNELLEDTEFELWANRQTGSLKKVGEAIHDWSVAQRKLTDGNRPLGVSYELWRKYVDTMNKLKVENILRAMRESKAFQAVLSMMAIVAPGAAEGVKKYLDSLGGETGESPIAKATKDTVKWADSLENVAQAFNKLKDLSGGLSPGIQNIAEIIGLMATGARIGDQARSLFFKPQYQIDPATGKVKTDKDNKPIPVVDSSGRQKYEFNKDAFTGKDGFSSAADAYTRAAAIAIEGYAAMQQATDVAGKGNRVMRGAATGYSIGNQIFPVVGGWVGFIGGALWGAIKKVPWEEIGKRIGSRLGISISEELGRKIQATAKERFGGDWHAAEIFHLGDVIQEAGGVTRDNFKAIAGEARDIFVMLSTGAFTLAEATTTLDNVFDQLLKTGTDRMGFISKEMRELVKLSYEYGVQSEKVLSFMNQQADSLIEAVNAMGKMPVQYDRWIGIGNRIAEARGAIDELNKETEKGVDWSKKMADEQKKLAEALTEQAAAAETAEAQLHDLGIVMAGNVFAAIAAGKSLSEAMMAAGEGLDALFAMYKSLGMTPNDPIVRLLQIQREVQTAIPNTIAGVNALGQSIVGLANMNLLTEESFQSIQDTAARAYTEIQARVEAAGGGTRDALLPMQDYLHRAEKAAKDLGLALDPMTQMLIDQSKELGIWKEAGPTAAERMESAIGRLIDKIDLMIDTMFEIPDELPNPYRNWKIPPVEIPDSPAPPGGHSPTPGAPTTPAQPRPDPTVASQSSGGSTPVILRVQNKDILTEIVTTDQDRFLASRGVRR